MKLKLGLFGFGCVGQGLYHVLNATQGIKAEIKRICVKTRNKVRPIAEDLFTYNQADILDDDDVDIVIEMIDDADAAFTILKIALQRGKSVVTANKKMLAEHLEEIFELQQKYRKPVLYEASVCGSIPILRNLEEYYDNDVIQSIEGIFNGSTNYVLTKIFEEKKSYDVVLKHAQELGFAESDPSLDVQAYDPKFKLVIAIAHAFGIFVKPENVMNIGINKISEHDFNYAHKNGLVIKLVAYSFREADTIFAFVAPMFIEGSSLLASVRNEFNAVIVKSAFAETQVFIGKGSGGYPTASAVLSDVSALTCGYTYEYKKLRLTEDLKFSNELILEAFISYTDCSSVSKEDFEELKFDYSAGGKRYMVGTISLQQLYALSRFDDVGIILSSNPVVTTHKILTKRAVALTIS